MKLLFVLVLLVTFTSFACACDDSKVLLTLISHQKVEATGSDPLLVRQVRFKITNKTGCPIFVKGNKISEFYPLGGYMKRYPHSKKWLFMSGGTEPPSFTDLGNHVKDYEEIPIDGSMEFTSKIGDADPSVKFKRIIYVSIGISGASANTILSSEFSFNGKL